MTDDLELLHRAGELLYGQDWQSELARALGISPRSVQRWVAGERLPAPERWAAIHALAVERGEELAHLLEELAARKGTEK
jgi:DNA-binding transcriptional regulator YdaS (Cro superfamily)